MAREPRITAGHAATPGIAGPGAHTARIHRVLAFIDLNLEHPLRLPELARIAHFSPFHFHRLFAAWTGETLGDYIRRRRVEIAAVRLVSQPRLTVLEVALSVGFGSAEAFARAFRMRFGRAASQWRREQARDRKARRHASARTRNLDQALRNTGQAGFPTPAENVGTPTSASEAPMQVTIIEREPVRVAYLRHTGPYGHQVARFWTETVAPWMRTHGLWGRARYGVSLDDPGVTSPARCRYDACVEIPATFRPVDPAQVTTLPGGTFAVLRFRGTADEIGEAWAGVLRDWLPETRYRLDARPFLECYPPDARHDPATGEFDCELAIPVAPM